MNSSQTAGGRTHNVKGSIISSMRTRDTLAPVTAATYAGGENSTAMAFGTSCCSGIAPTIPGTVNITSISAGDGFIDVFFPVVRSIITYMAVALTRAGDIIAEVRSTSSPIRLPSLPNNVEYNIIVIAIDEDGNMSLPSETVAATPIAQPATVTVSPRDSSVSVYYTIQGTIPITGYQWSLNNITYSSISSPPPNNTFTIPNLVNGKDYTVYVRFTNGTLVGIPSAPVTVRVGQPLLPVIGSVVSRTATSVTIGISVPTESVQPTYYVYSVNGGAPVTVGVSSAITITGLTSNQSCLLTVKAGNTYGETQFSAPTTIKAGIRYVVPITSSTSWTAPAGVTSVEYIVVGGGGGGGGCYSKLEVVGDVPYTYLDTPGINQYWISTDDNRMYKGIDLYTSAHPVRMRVTGATTYPIVPGETANIIASKWYGYELVYTVINGFPCISNISMLPYQRGKVVSPFRCNNSSAGSGGGSAGEIKTGIMQVTPGQTYQLVVGMGGQGGVAGPELEENGSNGGGSSFGTISVIGGAGGSHSRNPGSVSVPGYTVRTRTDTITGGRGGFFTNTVNNTNIPTQYSMFGGEGGAAYPCGESPPNIFNNGMSTYLCGYVLDVAYRVGQGGRPGIYRDINEDGIIDKYVYGGDGGAPGIVNTTDPPPNSGSGGNGTGATTNSYAPGRNGADGVVILKYEV